MKYNAIFAVMFLIAGAVAACSIANTPSTLNADCNTGNLTWTLTGCPASMNGTLEVGGSAVTVNSCSVGTDTGAGLRATAGGAATCITTVSTSQARGSTTHAVVDGDGGAGNASDTFAYNYCATYGTGDVGESVIDTIAGIFDGLAALAETYGIVVIALMVAGALVLIVAKFRV